MVKRTGQWLRNLGKLLIQTSRWVHTGYDFYELMQTIEKHTPDLESFEWSLQPFDEGDELPVFNTFKHLAKLHTLRIDIDLLVRGRDLGALRPGSIDDDLNSVFKPHELFPPSLQHLELAHTKSDADCSAADGGSIMARGACAMLHSFHRSL